jgi:CRP/FNR family transcriptional regulator, polysaccharide utilization system transcription regulator
LIVRFVKRHRDQTCEHCQAAFGQFFSHLNPEDLEFLNDHKQVMQVKRNELIFREGQRAQGVYCIREGAVKVYREGHDGRELITRFVFPGDFVGLKAIISGVPYVASALAIEDASVCFITKNDFYTIMVRYPEFTHVLAVSLTRMLEEAEERMISLAQKPVKERLAETLLFLDRSFHPHAVNGTKNYLNLSRYDLANIIGTVPETVIRLLSDFRDHHYIAIRGRKIFILNPWELQRIANNY